MATYYYGAVLGEIFSPKRIVNISYRDFYIRQNKGLEITDTGKSLDTYSPIIKQRKYFGEAHEIPIHIKGTSTKTCREDLSYSLSELFTKIHFSDSRLQHAKLFQDLSPSEKLLCRRKIFSTAYYVRRYINRRSRLHDRGMQIIIDSLFSGHTYTNLMMKVDKKIHNKFKNELNPWDIPFRIVANENSITRVPRTVFMRDNTLIMYGLPLPFQDISLIMWLHVNLPRSSVETLAEDFPKYSTGRKILTPRKLNAFILNALSNTIHFKILYETCCYISTLSPKTRKEEKWSPTPLEKVSTYNGPRTYLNRVILNGEVKQGYYERLIAKNFYKPFFNRILPKLRELNLDQRDDVLFFKFCEDLKTGKRVYRKDMKKLFLNKGER